MPFRFAISAILLACVLLVGCGVDLGVKEEPLTRVDSRVSFITTQLGESSDTLYSKVVIQTDGKYALAGEANASSIGYGSVARFTADGRIDTTFLTRGVVVSTLGLGSVYYSLLLQDDARLVGVGYTSTANGGSDLAFARYHTDGTLDTSFSTDGTAILAIAAGTEADRLFNGVMQTDGNIVAVGYSGTSTDWLIVRLNAGGALDTAFNTQGYRTTDISGSDELAYAVVLNTDGKLFAIGRTKISSDDDTGAARYNTDGTPDTSFHTDGKYAVSVDSGCDTAVSAALQTDGRYVLGGQTSSGGGSNSALISRMNTDGILDTSFFTSGTKKDAPFASTKGFRVVINTDGKVMVSGQDNTNANAYIGRYNTDGTRDTTFNGVGYNTLNMGATADLFYGIGILSSGEIIVGGTGGSGKKQDFAMAKYFADGTIDTSFFTRGYNTSSAGVPGTAEILGLVVQTDGALVAVGNTSVGISDAVALVRYTFDGLLDTSFATTGKTWDTSITTVGTYRRGVLQTDAKLLIVGDNGLTPSDILLARYNTSGVLDTSFRTDGTSNFDIAGAVDVGYALTLLPDGRGLLAGLGGGTAARLMRFHTDGQLDTSFNTSGASASAGVGYGYDVVLLSDGSALLGGTGSSDFLFARYNDSGALDTGFSTDGIAQIAFGTGGDIVYSLAVQPDGSIVGAGAVTNPNLFYFTYGVIRLSSDGIADTSFHTDGWVSFNLGTYSDYASKVLIQKNNKILLGGRKGTTFGGISDMALVRLMPDGTLDTSFNTSGVMSHSITSGYNDAVNDLILLTDGRYIGGGTGVKDGFTVFAVMRYFP